LKFNLDAALHCSLSSSIKSRQGRFFGRALAGIHIKIGPAVWLRLERRAAGHVKSEGRYYREPESSTRRNKHKMLHPHIDLSLWQEQDFGVESHSGRRMSRCGAAAVLRNKCPSFPLLRKKQNITTALCTLHNTLPANTHYFLLHSRSSMRCCSSTTLRLAITTNVLKEKI
jgi:hypothetical protein